LTTAVPTLDFWLHVNQNPEESVKSRILVWSLVGLVVVIGAIVILTAPKNSNGPKLTPEILKTEVDRAVSQLDKLVERLDARRKAVTPGATDAFGNADQLLAQAREQLEQARQATDMTEAQKQLQVGRETLRKARRAVELATKRR
jgi:hypothetical protein